MIKLSRTELIALQDEATFIEEHTRNKPIKQAASRIVDWLEAALQRREREVEESLTKPD